jgi:hypothetical protein
MAWRGLTQPHWDAIRVHLPESTMSARGERPRVDDRRCVEGLLWSCGRAPNGANDPGGMAVPAPAGGDSRPGKRRECSSSSGGPSWPSSMTGSSGAGRNALGMAALCPRNKGGQRREGQAGSGGQVDGAG